MDERLGSHDLSGSGASSSGDEERANLSSLERDQLPQVLAQEQHLEDSKPPLTLPDKARQQRDAATARLQEGLRLAYSKDSTDDDRERGKKMIDQANWELARLQGQLHEVAPPFPPNSKPLYRRRPHWIPKGDWPDDE